jgi:hypothetical protein
MKILKWIGLTTMALILILVGYLAYLGMFNPLTVTMQEMGPYTIAYERYVGPYQNTGPIFDKVYKELTALGITTTNGIGIYYDNPQNTPSYKLRSDCGVIMAKKDLSKLKGNLKVQEIKKSLCVVTEFPIKNMLSYMIGPMKAYPALSGFANKGKLNFSGPMFEIYNMQKDVIMYVAPVKK